MNIVMIASECVPFVKTGGLADVLGALPKALKALGHDVKIILPKYGQIDAQKHGLTRFMEGIDVWMGSGIKEGCAVDVAYLADDIPVYFIEHWMYFGRDSIYGDYGDNGERFAFFTRAALQLCLVADFEVDVVHTHDWHTGLAPVYLKTWPWRGTSLDGVATVFTIHNIQYQGNYGKKVMPYAGIGWQHFTADKLESYGGLNFMKGGIAFADKVTTVSPTYAQETRHSKLGMGMNNVLRQKGDRYLGILNGVDYEDWSPEVDPHIAQTYSLEALDGKQVCKQALQASFGLEQNVAKPLIGVVSRLADQKGLDVLYTALLHLLKVADFQFVLLGSGDKRLESQYAHLAHQYPDRVGVQIAYDNAKAHQIEAGADFFAMPSRFEPCGLNQMYSLRYGTLPIVRNTGGLADTIVQYDQRSGQGTGFKFDELSASAIVNTLLWVLDTWYKRPKDIEQMVKRAMQQDYSWQQSALQYEALYEGLLG